AVYIIFDYNRLDISLLSVWSLRSLRSCHRQRRSGKQPYRSTVPQVTATSYLQHLPHRKSKLGSFLRCEHCGSKMISEHCKSLTKILAWKTRMQKRPIRSSRVVHLDGANT